MYQKIMFWDSSFHDINSTKSFFIFVTCLIAAITLIKNQKTKKRTFLMQLESEFISNDDLYQAMHIIEFESDWFDSDSFYQGGNNSTEKKIDRLLTYLNKAVYKIKLIVMNMLKKYQKQNKNFTGTRDTQEFSEYEYEYENQSDNESGNKYNSYSSHGYSYSGKYSYQSSSNTSDNKDSNNSQEQQRRPLTELEKAYAALDLTEAATDKESKARRRNLMRLNHPDLVMQKGEAAVRSANLRCQEINKAFELIKATRGMK